ncbi:hypothetical protein ZIOFF_071225 [Zingiber officinale]|uniref:Uncharacterized protein n=1 Tax=Zingiber officinale TaxID=94328 RepID=A0A8J5C163_ZINOF|nr:hypothetical protein ZIOFF_071225 [Zingiber officinale]
MIPHVSLRFDSTAPAMRTTKMGSPTSIVRCGGTSAIARSTRWSGWAQELFLWLPVKRIMVIDPASSVILLDIGVTFKYLATSAFDVPPKNICPRVLRIEATGLEKKSEVLFCGDSVEEEDVFLSYRVEARRHGGEVKFCVLWGSGSIKSAVEQQLDRVVFRAGSTQTNIARGFRSRAKLGEFAARKRCSYRYLWLLWQQHKRFPTSDQQASGTREDDKLKGKVIKVGLPSNPRTPPHAGDLGHGVDRGRVAQGRGAVALLGSRDGSDVRDDELLLTSIISYCEFPALEFENLKTFDTSKSFDIQVSLEEGPTRKETLSIANCLCKFKAVAYHAKICPVSLPGQSLHPTVRLLCRLEIFARPVSSPGRPVSLTGRPICSVDLLRLTCLSRPVCSAYLLRPTYMSARPVCFARPVCSTGLSFASLSFRSTPNRPTCLSSGLSARSVNLSARSAFLICRAHLCCSVDQPDLSILCRLPSSLGRNQPLLGA